MYKIGFDNEKYIELQSAHIRHRIDQFGGKLYLEFGGKLFDDFHASRVLPGFAPDSKIRMLTQLSAILYPLFEEHITESLFLAFSVSDAETNTQ